MYRAMAVANYFLKLSFEENDQEITHMKLQKLVFLTHAWHLAIYDEPLILERVEAWRYGPVISSLYHEFKIFGRRSIDRYGRVARRPDSYANGSDVEIELIAPIVNEEDQRTVEHIKETWDVHKKFTPEELSGWLHIEGSPWHQAWSKYYGNSGTIAWYGTPVIDDSIIKNYYKDILKEAEEEESSV